MSSPAGSSSSSEGGLNGLNGLNAMNAPVPAPAGSLFGRALTSINTINSALWSRLETTGDVSDDAMSLASLTLEDAKPPGGTGFVRSLSMDSSSRLDFQDLDEQIASQAASMRMASATPTPTARPPRVVGNVSSDSIPESWEAQGGNDSGPEVDSYVQLEDVRSGGETVGYCFFRRDEEAVVQTKGPGGQLLRNFGPVFAKAVHCDAVVWTPLLGNDGSVGHCFVLEFRGAQQARIESFFGDDASATSPPTRIAVVNALCTPMAMAAKLVDKGSMVEFSPPCRHASKLKKLLDTMQSANREDDMYLPVKEVVLGPALRHGCFEKLLQLPAHLKEHSHSEHAVRAWERTVDSLRAISDETRRGVTWHNRRELARL